MQSVNKGLTEPLAFEQHFLSLQKVRNCLEHRDGVVMQEDVDDGVGPLVLSFPRLMVFYERGGEAIEVRVGGVIEDEDGEGAKVGMKMVTETREYKVGERIVFSPNDFNDIGWGCWAFANELSQKLPTIETKAS